MKAVTTCFKEDDMVTTVLGRFKVIGYLEGVSFLLLLLVVMPFKYMAGIDQAVSIVEMAHGVLFVLYILAALHAFSELRWGGKKLLLALGASVLPVGTFVFKSYLKKEIRAGLAALLLFLRGGGGVPKGYLLNLKPGYRLEKVAAMLWDDVAEELDK
ncbi:DUF3817 domain-containing protein [Paenibacillus sp. NPDC055715]